MASEIEAAAELVLRWDGEFDGGTTRQAAQRLAKWVRDRLAADRAERDERSRPIDEVFLRSRGFLPDGTCDGREFGCRIWGADEDVSYGEHAAFQIKVSMIDHSTWLECYDTAGDTIGLTEIPIARTQGALGDLLRVLKGGA